MAHSDLYPTTEQTLAALSMVLNGGGVGQLQDITEAFSTAFRGREKDLRSLIEQLDRFTAYLNDQTGDIIAAAESLNHLVGQLAEQQPVVDRALETIPDALAVLNEQRDNLVDAADQLGKFGALVADTVNQSKEDLVKILTGHRTGPGVSRQRRPEPDPGAQRDSRPSHFRTRPSKNGNGVITPT